MNSTDTNLLFLLPNLNHSQYIYLCSPFHTINENVSKTQTFENPKI